MKIRHRITLWITGAGLLAGLLFSGVIFFEMSEQPYALLDSALESQAHTLLAGFVFKDDKLALQNNTAMLDVLGQLYWLKVVDSEQNDVYVSALATRVELPFKRGENGYNISVMLPEKGSGVVQEGGGEKTFRVRVFPVPFGDRTYFIQVARPMEKLQEEITDLILSIIVGLAFFTLSLILFGYFAAGRILKPIAEMNLLAREISENTLNKRIPLGRNQDELYALSSSLNEMFDRLQFSFQRQKEFVASASHELKTPLTMQRLFFDEAAQRDDLPDDFYDGLKGQRKTLYRMDRLVKGLLDLSALEINNSCKPESCDLSALVVSVLKEYQEMFQAAGIELQMEIEDGVALQADKEQIRRMLINLIDNSIKYSGEENKEIRVCLAKENDGICMEVYNTGPGIPAEELELVFDQFYRVEKSRSTALGGSGLGLTIVKRIVNLHHGTVVINNETGKWVRVSVHLPLTFPVDR